MLFFFSYKIQIEMCKPPLSSNFVHNKCIYSIYLSTLSFSPSNHDKYKN